MSLSLSLSIYFLDLHIEDAALKAGTVHTRTDIRRTYVWYVCTVHVHTVQVQSILDCTVIQYLVESEPKTPGMDFSARHLPRLQAVRSTK